MGSFVLCFARLLKLHVKCCQRICLLVSVLVHSVTSGRNDSFIDKVAVTKPVCLSLLLDCWNSQQSSGRTGECLCHCALTLAGKSIISSIFDYFSLKLDHWFRKPFRGPTSLDNVGGGLIIIAEDPPKSHIGAPEHFLLSQERSPVRKNPQHISVFCTFGGFLPTAQWGLQGPDLRHWICDPRTGDYEEPSLLWCRVFWYIFTDLLTNVVPHSPFSEHAHSFETSPRFYQSTKCYIQSNIIFKKSLFSFFFKIPLCNWLTSDPISIEILPFCTWQ